ncbi:MAG TPA: hypothetical protein VIR03_02010 [Candidatus Saccharimonadales bacterium]
MSKDAKNNRPTSMGAKRSSFEVQRLIVLTANAMLGDERLMQNEPVRVRAAEYLGWLMDRAYESDLEGRHNAQLSVVALLYEGGHEMRVRYGNPQLAGVDSQMAPVSLEDACNAADAVEALREHMTNVYAAQYS